VFKKSGPSLQRLRLATILLVTSFAVLIVAVAIYYVTEQYNSAVAAAARSARSTATALEAQATRTFAETYRVLEGLGDIYEHRLSHGGIDDRALHDLLKAKLAQTPDIYVFSVFDPQFRGVASGRSFPMDEELYRTTGVPLRALSTTGTRRLFGPIYKVNLGGEEWWNLPLGYKIVTGGDQVLGYAVSLMRATHFASSFETQDVGAHGRIAMWTDDGKLIAGSANVRLAQGAAIPSAPTTSGAEEITVNIPITGVPASIGVTLDSRDYMAGWRQTRTQIAIAVAVIVLAMGSFTLIILRQLSQSQKDENALRQAKALAEEANDAKSRFLAHMSHEFRTPLNAIMGFSEIIRNRVLGDGVSNAYTAYADHIHRSGEHLLNIVNDILDMAKIESGVQPLHQDTVDVPAAVSAAVSFVQGLATQRGLRIAVDAPAHLAGVSGDERFIRQVLINLLSNAIKFSPPESEIQVRASYRAGHWLDIAVRDSGPGIEPSLLRRLGEPFLQGNPAVSQLGKGTGLGLSICKRYMDVLGGELRIESVVGIGTTATIRFPNTLLVPTVSA